MTLRAVIDAPNIDVQVVGVSFRKMKDKAEARYLENLPTSFVLSDDAVDRLRAAAGKIIEDSPEFRMLIDNDRAKIANQSGATRRTATVTTSN